MSYDNLRIGDRVTLGGTDREGTVVNLTSSPGWVDQAQVNWDDGVQDDGLVNWPPTAALRRLGPQGHGLS